LDAKNRFSYVAIQYFCKIFTNFDDKLDELLFIDVVLRECCRDFISMLSQLTTNSTVVLDIHFEAAKSLNIFYFYF
jgi:hypothetical protein